MPHNHLNVQLEREVSVSHIYVRSIRDGAILRTTVTLTLNALNPIWDNCREVLAGSTRTTAHAYAHGSIISTKSSLGTLPHPSNLPLHHLMLPSS